MVLLFEKTSFVSSSSWTLLSCPNRFYFIFRYF